MAEALPVGRLLRPRSVAIVGASPDRGTIGNNVLVNLERSGFTGAIHLVSRSRAEIAGRPCVPTIDDLPKGIDAVALVVPEAAVPDAVEACVRAEAGSAVVFASGFAEMGGDGRAHQQRMEDAARSGGLVMLGPNCIGYTNFADGTAITFEPLGDNPPPRAAQGAMVIAQSGAMTTNLRLGLIAKGVPVTAAISTGNEAVAGIEDFLADALAGESARQIVLFVEQVRRPKLFLELARKAREIGRIIIMLHPGRTERARNAALSHTGALAGDHALMSAVLENENVILVDTVDEMFDAPALLARWPAPPPEGTAIVTNSGAFRGVALDFCAEEGLDLPALAPATQEKLKAMLPPYAAIDNPLDITTIGISQLDIFGRTAGALLEDPGTGSLVAAFIPGAPFLQVARARSLLPVIEASAKPVAFSLFGDETPLASEFLEMARAASVPLFRSPDRALRAMARVQDYGRLLARQRRPAATLTLPTLPPSGAVAEHRAKGFLAALGIAVPAGALVRTLDEALGAAQRIGFPVVLKAQSRDLPHKSEAGGVIAGIADAAALTAAWERLHANIARARPGLALDGVLVEAQAAPGVEMILGARRDPEWGPVLLVGLGGVWTEALGDVRLLTPDRTEADIVAEMLRLKGAALLQGHRGTPAANLGAAARAALVLADLMRTCPAIREIEVNPLVVHAEGALALDALMAVD
ncbi:MAG TPA: acetate--CoA ligase family protein [Stellaceae bacterium]|nr:acetate--CoA ligase family protein [Stellaceae bacterium]